MQGSKFDRRSLERHLPDAVRFCRAHLDVRKRMLIVCKDGKLLLSSVPLCAELKCKGPDPCLNSGSVVTVPPFRFWFALVVLILQCRYARDQQAEKRRGERARVRSRRLYATGEMQGGRYIEII